jgi:hypothetical protein
MPLIYYVGRYNTIFTGYNFLWWVGQGLVTSLALFFLTTYAYTEAGVLDANSGQTTDLWLLSTTVGLAILITGNLKAWILSRYISNWNFIAFFAFSFGFYYSYLWGAHFIEWVTISYTIVELHSTYLTYFVVGCFAGLCHSVDRMIMLYRCLIDPKPADFL